MKGTAYLIQATLIVLWWIGLISSKQFYNAFQFPGISEIGFNSFMLPDLSVIAVLSVVRAYKSSRDIEFVILGGFAFATLYCLNASILSGGGFLPTSIMTLGLSYNFFVILGHKVFRVSNTSNRLLNTTKTVVQIICVWTITLLFFPLLILNSFGHNIPELSDINILGLFLFLVFSIYGLYSALIMVKEGKGTPLPIDQTQKLVTNGPYRFVRNPMAVAGIGQGISISIMVGSIHIFFYSMLGAVLWHFVVKPLEEKDMEKRFGKDYSEYKQNVGCWIPKFKW